MLGGFTLFSVGSDTVKRYLIFTALSALIISFSVSHAARVRTGFFKLLSLLLLLSCLLSHFYFVRFDPSTRYDEEVKISGQVVETDDSSLYKTSLVISAFSIENGELGKEKRILARISKSDAQYIYKGAVITFKAKLKSIESSEDFDARSYYYSNGICAEAVDFKLTDVSEPPEETVGLKLSLIRENISRQSMLTMGEDAGSLFAAVFMGQRSYLSPRLSLDFGRIGISHILALSGMHLAILAIGLTKILSLFGISKKPRTVIIIFLIVFYMALTGFSVSVVRAGIMLIISSLLYLFASAKDLPTNLAISVFLICLITPYAVFDISLWLSAFATFGIVAMTDIASQKLRKKNVFIKLLSTVGASFAASFFAISATMLITTAISDKTSLLGAFSTLIFSFLIEVFIYVGLLILAVGFIFPIGAYVMEPLYSAIDKLSYALSSPRWIIVSTDEVQIRALIIVFTVIFFAFIVLKIKRIKLALLLLVCSFIAVHGFAAAQTYADAFSDGITYGKDANHEIFTLKSNGTTAVLDFGSYTENTAYETVDMLSEQNVFSLDAYITTNYSSRMDESIKTLLSRIKTEAVYVPEAVGEDEERLLALTELVTDEFKTALVTYSVDTVIKIGSITVEQPSTSVLNASTAGSVFRIACPGHVITYISSGALKNMTKEQVGELTLNSNTLIFGSHGKKYSVPYVYANTHSAVKRIIVSGKSLSLDDDALSFYKKNGTEIITDLGTAIKLIH
ncbi:MAG: ComEC/Rec2 family competence protein [Clostridia bacterium]|nr:ComEC/Rec2 family competence protein [Clostridia bacterium]